MTTLTDPNWPNLLNWAKMHDDTGKLADIVNVLSKKNPILEDMPWQEGNLVTGHQITRTSNSLPSGTWRKINAGIAATKVETDQFTETCGMLEDESVVDEALAKLNGDQAAYRKKMDDIKLVALSQQFSTAVLYESVATNPERIHGFTPRYPASTGFDNSGYVIRGGGAAQSGGTADNRSIWLIDWDPDKMYGIFPKGSMAGLQKEDKGLLRVQDPNDSTKYLYAYVTHFIWKCGLAIEDYRYAVRCQWDPSDTTTFSATSKELVLSMQDMLNTIYDTGSGMLRFYMDRTSKMRIDRELAANGETSLLSYLDAGGKRIQTFMGVPMRIEDALVQESYIA